MTTDQDWQLFTDWCEAHELNPLPADLSTVSFFLRRVPASHPVQRRRVRAIRLRHQGAREMPPSPFPYYRPPTAWRTGAGWVGLPRALAQLPRYRYPVGLRGRRDGFLLSLIGIVELSRSDAAGILPSEIQTTGAVTISGHRVEQSSNPDTCPACAVTRWLRIVRDVNLGQRRAVWDTLAPETPEPEDHDCGVPLANTWVGSPVLLPAIDKYGWAAGASISSRTVSHILATRQRPAGFPERWAGTVRPAPIGRFANATSDELAAAYDDVDEQLTALLARSGELLDDAGTVLDWLDENR